MQSAHRKKEKEKKGSRNVGSQVVMSICLVALKFYIWFRISGVSSFSEAPRSKSLSTLDYVHAWGYTFGFIHNSGHCLRYLTYSCNMGRWTVPAVSTDSLRNVFDQLI